MFCPEDSFFVHSLQYMVPALQELNGKGIHHACFWTFSKKDDLFCTNVEIWGAPNLIPVCTPNCSGYCKARITLNRYASLSWKELFLELVKDTIILLKTKVG